MGAGATKRICRIRIISGTLATHESVACKTERDSLLFRRSTVAKRTTASQYDNPTGATQKTRSPRCDPRGRLSTFFQQGIRGDHAHRHRTGREDVYRQCLYLLRVEAGNPLRDLRPMAAGTRGRART